MGIGYKTSWLAVQNTTFEDVANALDLQHCLHTDWTSGTAAAYKHGVFVATPVPGWTIAHSRLHLPPNIDASNPRSSTSFGR